LSGLVDAILAHTEWNLGRETKAALPLLKPLGDRSARNRHDTDLDVAGQRRDVPLRRPRRVSVRPNS